MGARERAKDQRRNSSDIWVPWPAASKRHKEDGAAVGLEGLERV